MHPRILHLLSDLVANDVNLLARVLEHAGEEGVGEGLEALHDLQVVPGADFFLRGGENEKRNHRVSKVHYKVIAIEGGVFFFSLHVPDVCQRARSPRAKRASRP